jgi:hypothetical protein
MKFTIAHEVLQLGKGREEQGKDRENGDARGL